MDACEATIVPKISMKLPLSRRHLRPMLCSRGGLSATERACQPTPSVFPDLSATALQPLLGIHPPVLASASTPLLAPSLRQPSFSSSPLDLPHLHPHDPSVSPLLRRKNLTLSVSFLRRTFLPGGELSPHFSTARKIRVIRRRLRKASCGCHFTQLTLETLNRDDPFNIGKCVAFLFDCVCSVCRKNHVVREM